MIYILWILLFRYGQICIYLHFLTYKFALLFAATFAECMQKTKLPSTAGHIRFSLSKFLQIGEMVDNIL